MYGSSPDTVNWESIEADGTELFDSAGPDVDVTRKPGWMPSGFVGRSAARLLSLSLPAILRRNSSMAGGRLDSGSALTAALSGATGELFCSAG